MAVVLSGRGVRGMGYRGGREGMIGCGKQGAEHEILTISRRICFVEIFCSILSNVWLLFASISVPFEVVLKLI